jgi:hypothetical protein
MKGIIMKPYINKKFMILMISIICIILVVAPISNAGLNTKQQIKFEKYKIGQLKSIIDHSHNGPENWALLFAVGEYYLHPYQDRPSMIRAVNDLHNVLVNSPGWKSENIHKVMKSQATGSNLIRELLWLIRSADKDDYTLIYITTHGSPLLDSYGQPLDYPPKDEADGADEILVMYHGFETSYSYIWDDLLNFLVSLIKSKVCLIVDSCYAGGFDDYPMRNQDRVTLMSSREDETCYGSYFSDYLIDGLLGLADLGGNLDGINSAEEAFRYASFWVRLLHTFTPTMRDLYPISDPLSREFPLT